MVIFDTNFLVLLLQDDAPGTTHPDTGEEIANVKERIEHLLESLHRSRTKVLIPTPVLAELFAGFGSSTDEIVQLLTDNYNFEFAPFSVAAAIETGMAFYSARQTGDKRSGSKRAWQRVKFDRQIVSIAKVNRASAVYSNDSQVRKWAEDLGMNAIAVWDLDKPPGAQTVLDLTENETVSANDEVDLSEELTDVEPEGA